MGSELGTSTDVPGEAPGPPRTEAPAGGRPPTRAGNAGRLLRRTIGGLRRFLDAEDRRFRLAFSLGVAVAFTALLAVSTRGGLLYGEDYIGAYAWNDFFLRPRTDYLLPSIWAGVLPGHLYAAFYLTEGCEVALVVFACQSLARSLFRRSLAPFDLRLAGAIAGVLYMLSPALVTYRYVSLLQLLVPSSAAFLFVLAFAVDTARALRENVTLSWTRAAAFGVAIGFSGPDSVPNELRILMLEGALLVGLLLEFAVLSWRPRARSRAGGATLFRTITASVPVGLLLLAYPLFTFATSGVFGPGSIGVVAAATAQSHPSGGFDTLGLAARLLGRHTFPVTPYASLYSTNLPVVLGSYLWPVLALLVPPAVAAWWRVPDRALVLLAAGTAAVGAAWDAGSNPPFGPVYGALVAHLPYGATLFQPYSVSLLLLAKLYPVLIGFSAVVLGRLAGVLIWPPHRPLRAPGPRWHRWAGWADPQERLPRRRLAAVASGGIAVALAATAALAGLPILQGSVTQDFGSSSGHGFFVPPEYGAVRDLLTTRGGGALLLPELSTYVQTSWGYTGANGFYDNFYAPSPVLVPAFFGPYSDFFPNVVRTYANATNPVEPGAMTANASLRTSPPYLSTPLGGGLRYDFGHANRSAGLDLSGVRWLTATFPIRDPTWIAGALAARALWVGLGAGKVLATPTAWYTVGNGSNAWLDALTPTNLTVTLMPSSPSLGTVNATNVTWVSVWLRDPAPSFGLIAGPPVLTVGNATELVPGWMAQIRGYGMRYVLVDDSIVLGAMQSYPLVDSLIDILEADGVLVPVYSGALLSLYAITPGGIGS